ncbi:MAG TPA: hypothetical protein VHE35_05730 [Kofleriaceae bacterium]|nr:hypothetical protein [Kofleriaceae bacterium]
MVRDPATRTRTACVVAGASPEQVAAAVETEGVAFRRNALGTLVTGTLGPLPIDFAHALPGPVYDVFYNRSTGWFAVTIYRGEEQPVRWDNRPGTECGYPRVDDILGAATPTAILAALDLPADVLGYALA